MARCRQALVLVAASSFSLFACSDEQSTNQNLGTSSSTVIGGSMGTGGRSTTIAFAGGSGGASNGGTTASTGTSIVGGSSNATSIGGVGGRLNAGGTSASAVGGTLTNSGGAVSTAAVGGKSNTGGTSSALSATSAAGGASSLSVGGSKTSGGASSKSASGGNTTLGGGKGTGGNVTTGGSNGSGGVIAAGGNSGSGGIATTGGNTSASNGCIVATFLSSLGKTSPLIGASMEDDTATAAPFDSRYLYLSGGYFDGAEPCASCASGCTADGASCSNAGGGCGWWGCWQWDQDPPGQYVLSFVSVASSATYAGQANPQIPLITYYQVLQASGVDEGRAEVAALDNAAFLHRYFSDFRLVLQKVGSAAALLHIEPDFWGYVQQSGNNPHVMPAPVTDANPTDCGSVENSVAGFARCLIAMARKYTPNARIGLHASGWGTNYDVLDNDNISFDVVAEAKKLANYLLELGAGEGDFVVADMSDRDAGYYQQLGRSTFYDATNAKLPNFHQAFEWAKAVSDTIGKPIVWWQVPVGNMSLNNTTDQYQDNRVDYLLTHMDEVVAANGAGVFFGAGATGQTTPESDGGNLVAKVKAYSAARAAACP